MKKAVLILRAFRIRCSMLLIPLVDAAEIRKKLPIWAENVENRTASWLSEQSKATKRENKHLDDKLLRRVHKRL